ncbi:MAG: acyloxyacyl hydrolase [Acidobacteriota bacterium]
MTKPARLFLIVLSLSFASPRAHAEPKFIPETLSVYLGGGKNPMNSRGHSVFRSIQFEVSGHSPRIAKWLGPKMETGMALKYSDVRQARSWFGYSYGEPDDSVRAESAFFFLRRGLGSRFYGELGTGPMWSNRRVPAATSRLNFESQAGLGVNLGSSGRFPLRLGYRFSHISNAGLASRNPGLNVHSFMIGTRVRTFRPRDHVANPRSSTRP